MDPLAGNMAKLAEDEHAFYHVLRVLMASFMKGAPPIMAVEMARRAIPGHVRPSFKEVEKNLPNRRCAPAAPPRKPEHRDMATRAKPNGPSLSSRKRADTAAITAARGKSPMPTL